MARVDPQIIRQGLIQRGLPPHVADGFVMNMRDESGLNPGINEISPLVPGSRGGFGLYQLTGPRRRAYEQYASQRGVNVADPNAQLDFLMMELQGPERRAAQSIFSAPDANTAAVAIARDFLRPAPENLQKRVAQYAGGGGLLASNETLSTQGRTAGQGEPMAEERGLLGGLLNPDRRDRLIMALEGMTLNPNQALIQASGEAIKGRAADRKTTKQSNATLRYLEGLGTPQAQEAIRYGSSTGDMAGALKMALAKPETTALQQNYEYALSQGMTPEQARAWVSSGTTVNVTGDGAPGLGKLGTDYGYVMDPATGQPVIDPNTGLPRAAPIPGSETARRLEAEAQATQQQQAAGQRQQGIQESVVSRDVDALVGMIDNKGMFNLPEAGILGNMLGTLGINQEAVTFKNTLESIQATIAFDALQKMREASKTGGALGGVSERELDLLINSRGALKQSTDPEVLKRNLLDIKRIMTKIENDPIASRAYYGFAGQGSTQGAAPASSGGFSVTGRID